MLTQNEATDGFVPPDFEELAVDIPRKSGDIRARAVVLRKEPTLVE